MGLAQFLVGEAKSTKNAYSEE